jgi:antitoxin VapB
MDKPVETIVEEAIAAKAEVAGVTLARGPRLSGQALIQRMTEISEHCAALPVLDPRTPDEIIGYDDLGLPR